MSIAADCGIYGKIVLFSVAILSTMVFPGAKATAQSRTDVQSNMKILSKQTSARLIDAGDLIVNDFPGDAARLYALALKISYLDKPQIVSLKLKLGEAYLADGDFGACISNIEMENIKGISAPDARKYVILKAKAYMNAGKFEGMLHMLAEMPDGMDGFPIDAQVDYAYLLGRYYIYKYKNPPAEALDKINIFLSGKKQDSRLADIAVILNSRSEDASAQMQAITSDPNYPEEYKPYLFNHYMEILFENHKYEQLILLSQDRNLVDYAAMLNDHDLFALRLMRVYAFSLLRIINRRSTKG